MPEPKADCHETLPLEGLKILLADDVAVIRHLYSTAFSRAGAAVTAAADGEQALLLWKSAIHLGSPFDIVVLDYAMPGHDGGVVAAALRDAGFTGPIMGVSAEVDRAGAKRWSKLGCDEVLEKGVALTALVARIAEAFRIGCVKTP